eukprot:3847488-Alexandrium_andersonii.AAC.1
MARPSPALPAHSLHLRRGGPLCSSTEAMLVSTRSSQEWKRCTPVTGPVTPHAPEAVPMEAQWPLLPAAMRR